MDGEQLDMQDRRERCYYAEEEARRAWAERFWGRRITQTIRLLPLVRLQIAFNSLERVRRRLLYFRILVLDCIL